MNKKGQFKRTERKGRKGKATKDNKRNDLENHRRQRRGDWGAEGEEIDSERGASFWDGREGSGADETKERSGRQEMKNDGYIYG